MIGVFACGISANTAAIVSVEDEIGGFVSFYAADGELAARFGNERNPLNYCHDGGSLRLTSCASEKVALSSTGGVRSTAFGHGNEQKDRREQH